MFSGQVLIIMCISYLFSSKGEGSPLNIKVTTDAVPVVGHSEVNLATCTVSTSQSPAKLSWNLDILFVSVKEITTVNRHLDKTYTVTSSLIGTPTVEMNEKNIQCVVRHPTLNEELAKDHKIVVHYPPQLVVVTPFKNLIGGEGFQCEADANPTATRFNWKRMYKAIHNDAIKINGNILYFLKMTSDLNGLYICEASNEYGTGFGSLYWQEGEILHSEL